MVMERFGKIEYRDDLVTELRQTDDRGERLSILADAKNSDDYVQTASMHSIDRNIYRSEQSLAHALQESKTLDELKEAIAHGAFSIPNEFCGRDHSEHLLKRIDMAKKLGDMSLIPDIDGFREKVIALQGVTQESERQTYHSFITERFPNLVLRDEELLRIEENLPKEIFATIDTPLEKVILLANVFPNIKTAFSCAGHTELEGDALHGPGNVYLTLRATGDERTTATMNNLNKLLNRPHGSYNAEVTLGDQSAFYFHRPPTAEWILEHGKKSPEELFVESKNRLSELLDAPEFRNVSEKDFFEKLLSLQHEYLLKNPEAATVPYAPNSRFLVNIAELTPERLKAEEYKEFLFAPLRFEEREALMAELEEDMQAVRVSATVHAEEDTMTELRRDIEQTYSAHDRLQEESV